MQTLKIIALICFISSTSNCQESTTAVVSILASTSINVTDKLITNNTNNNKLNVSLARITQPSLNIETYARLNEKTAPSKNKSKLDFIPSPQLETYIEYNKYHVKPAFSEAKQMPSQFTYLPPAPPKDSSAQDKRGNMEKTTPKINLSTDKPTIMAQDKQLFPTSFDKPIRNDYFFPSHNYYERFNYGHPAVSNSLFPSMPATQWYNKIVYPVKPSIPVAEHPYPFVTDLTKVTPAITLPKSMIEHSVMTPWKKAAKIFAAILPIGLLISALTPNILTISSVNSTEQQCRKLAARAENIGLDKKLIEKWSKPGCEARLLCETAVREDGLDVETVKTLFWSFVSQNAEDLDTAEEIEEVSNAIKEKNCDKILCRKLSKTTRDTIKKHKTEEDN